MNKLEIFKKLSEVYENLDNETTETYSKAIEAVENGLWLGVYGDVGVGKTSLLMNLRAWGLIKFIRVSEYDIVLQYQKEGVKGIEGWNDVKTLLIDDIGLIDTTKKHMGNELNVLEMILYTRLEHNRPTYFTSNMDADALKEYLGLRIFDRMQQKISLIHFQGKSKRKPEIKEKQSLVESEVKANDKIDWQFKIDEHLKICKEKGMYVETWAATHLAPTFFVFLQEKGLLCISIEEKKQVFEDMIKQTKGYFQFQGIKKEDSEIQGIAIQRCRGKYYKDWVIKQL